MKITIEVDAAGGTPVVSTGADGQTGAPVPGAAAASRPQVAPEALAAALGVGPNPFIASAAGSPARPQDLAAGAAPSLD